MKKCLFSFFHIKSSLISIRYNHQTLRPGRRPSHLLTDRHKGSILPDLDDQFIMHMGADPAVRQRPHSIAKNIPGYRLHDILTLGDGVNVI